MDLSKSTPETTREIVREAEIYLQGQLILATSADQRASVMASVFTAAGAVIVAGLTALVTSDTAAAFGPVMAGGAVSGALFLIGAGLCVWATLPVGFDLPGSQPDSWKEDVEAGVPLEKALAEQAEHYQGKIADNRDVLKANASKFKWGAISGIAAPVVGFFVWVVTSFFW